MRICALFYLFLHYGQVSGQTYLSPIIGYDLAKIEDFDSLKSLETNLTLLEKGFSVGSPTIGLKVKKILTKNFFLSIIIEYTHKKIKSSNYVGIVIPKAISFNYFKNNISVNFQLGDYSIGFGGNYNLLNNISYVFNNKAKGKFTDQTDEKAIRIAISRNINRFNIEFYFNQGLTTIQDSRDNLYLNNISSFGLHLGYNSKI